MQVFVTALTATGAVSPVPRHIFNANAKFDEDSDDTKCGDVFEFQGDDCTVATGDTKVPFNQQQKIRVVVDELLQGSTLEEFVCACVGPTGSGMCGNMVTSALDPVECGDDPNTDVDEAGRWLDIDNNGLPDKSVLLKGVVTVSCGGATVYESASTDGYYQPSGNQLVPVSIRPGQGGLGALGPAIVVSTAAGLRSNSECTVAVKSSVVDKDGNPVPSLPATVVFHTDVLKATVPAAAADKTKPVTVTFNGKLDPATIATITIKKKDAMANTTATVALDATGTKVVITPAAPLDASSTYEISIPATVTDALGGPFPAAATLTVMTGA